MVHQPVCESVQCSLKISVIEMFIQYSNVDLWMLNVFILMQEFILRIQILTLTPFSLLLPIS